VALAISPPQFPIPIWFVVLAYSPTPKGCSLKWKNAADISLFKKMCKLTSSLLFALLIVATSLVGSEGCAFAADPLETSGNVRWIVFASRQDVDEAIGLARRFGSEFGSPAVISTTNGWYAVAAGPIAVPDPAALKKKLSDAWWPPKDSFFSKGQTFIERAWEQPKSPVLASASSSENDPHIALAAGLEVRIEFSHGRKVVRLRSAGQDVAGTSFDDDGPYNSTGVLIVKLDASSAFPQVVATHFTGGAHCCTLMRVLTFVGGRWETVNIGEFDSDGPQIEDLNGDGAAVLIGKDESFDYAFDSYAGSYAPPKIFRLTGNRITDVSQSPEFRRPILQMLLANQGLATRDMWRGNGFLAGWVAHNAMLGNGAEAWRKMLGLYNRNSDWDLSICTVATKGFDPCPDYAKRLRDFPTALQEHLAKYGYSIEGVTIALTPALLCPRRSWPPQSRPTNRSRSPSRITKPPPAQASSSPRTATSLRMPTLSKTARRPA
jgi:hypothetical protein